MSGFSQDKVVELLARFIEDRTGLHHPARTTLDEVGRTTSRDLLGLKLSSHAEENGFPTLLDYYYALRYDDPSSARWHALVDVLITGETYFYRERSGLERIVERVAERAQDGRPTRIWSAACATGEEPLSLALLLASAGLLERTQIVATDISTRQIARARRGDHTHRALRACPDGTPPWLRAEDGVAVVDPEIRDRVEWGVVNLVEAGQVRALGTFDVILCRNVLIYFEDQTVRRTAALLTAALAPGGILLIGASESLERLGTPLACNEQRGTFVYSRATG